MIRIVEHVMLIIGLILLLLFGIIYLLIPNHENQVEGLGWCGTTGSVLFEQVDSTLLNHPGRVAFDNNCLVCHDIRWVVVGPALMDMSERRDAVWLRRMIKNGMELIESGDTIANLLFQEYSETVHPPFTDLQDSTIENIIDYIDLASDREVIYETVPAAVP